MADKLHVGRINIRLPAADTRAGRRIMQRAVAQLATSPAVGASRDRADVRLRASSSSTEAHLSDAIARAINKELNRG